MFLPPRFAFHLHTVAEVDSTPIDCIEVADDHRSDWLTIWYPKNNVSGSGMGHVLLVDNGTLNETEIEEHVRALATQLRQDRRIEMSFGGYISDYQD